MNKPIKDPVKHFIVSLERPHQPDEAERLRNVLAMVKGVWEVEPCDIAAGDVLKSKRIQEKVEQIIWDQITRTKSEKGEM